jgi:hypothetical protein
MLERIKPINGIVTKLLDSLPESVWTSSTTTFFDPAIGGGQFVAEIEHRLRAHGHSDKNIHSRVFGFEYTSALVDLAVNMHKLVGQYAKTSYEDYFTLDDSMKFDVIVGNPPYRPQGDNRLGSRGASEMWANFVTQNLYLLNDNGYMAYIHPNAWRKPKDRNGFWKLLTRDNQMINLFMSTGADIGFEVRVDSYVIQKTPKHTTTTVVDHENITLELDLAKFDWLPNYAIEEIEQLLGSDTNVLYNTFYHTQREHSDSRTKKFKYPVVHTINKEGLGVRYFDKLQEEDSTHFGVAKVLLNQNELQYPYNDYKGEYGMSQLTFGIPIASKKQGDEIIKFLNSEPGRRMIAATKWNTYYTDYGMFNSFKADWYK